MSDLSRFDVTMSGMKANKDGGWLRFDYAFEKQAKTITDQAAEIERLKSIIDMVDDARKNLNKSYPCCGSPTCGWSACKCTGGDDQ